MGNETEVRQIGSLVKARGKGLWDYIYSNYIQETLDYAPW